MLGREHRDHRLLEPHLHVVRRRRLRLAEAEEHGALGVDEDTGGSGLEVRNRVAGEGAGDADAVRSVGLDFGGLGLVERDERRLLAVLLEDDVETAHVLRLRRGERHLDRAGLADVFGGFDNLDGRPGEAAGIQEEAADNQGAHEDQAEEIAHPLMISECARLTLPG